jgi:hypothetical protein
MRITQQKNLVNLDPDTPEERAMLKALWRTLIDCNGASLKLGPIGDFMPPAHASAQFVIEGPGADALPQFPELVVDFACKVYCDTCNRIHDLKPGDTVPLCCGKLMQFMD